MKNLSWKTLLIFVVIVIALVYVLPSVKPGMWPNKKINLGLDLQGGMHLVLEVDTEKALENHTDRIRQEIRDNLKKEHIRFDRLDRTSPDSITISVIGQEKIAEFKKFIEDKYDDMIQRNPSQANDVYTVTLAVSDKDAAHIKTMARSQALETIRNRIDQFGVSEPDIRSQGEKRILIQLPGINDPQRAKEIIGKTALLEFKLVDELHIADAAKTGITPPGDEWVKPYAQGNHAQSTPYLLKKRTLLTGANLTDARVEFGQFNRPQVAIEFDRKGARIFEQITGENIKKRLAIVLDNRVHTAPVIQDKISGGRAQITGNYTLEEAKDLAIVLRAGALPAPVKILEERTVGPSLGADSIRQGLTSMVIGGLLVVLFMIVYYKLSGVVADVALVMNILLIGAGLAAFQATLTLPGIAGIILTIGMAVDANVLIFERIREELEIGKTPLSAVDSGYQRATLTILDANVTTLIAALVLFQFGTGPIKGFAVTLSLGVVASMFTALIVTRAVFDFLLVNRKMKHISI